MGVIVEHSCSSFLQYVSRLSLNPNADPNRPTVEAGSPQKPVIFFAQKLRDCVQSSMSKKKCKPLMFLSRPPPSPLNVNLENICFFGLMYTSLYKSFIIHFNPKNYLQLGCI